MKELTFYKWDGKEANSEKKYVPMYFYIGKSQLRPIPINHPKAERALQLYIKSEDTSKNETLRVEIPMDKDGDMHGLNVVV